MSWDLFCKALVKEYPQDFVEYFVPGAAYVGMRECQLQTRVDSSFDPREIRADVAPEAKRGNGHLLVNVEWQASKDEKMDERLLGYSHELTRLHRLPVYSVVIYTQEVSDIPSSPLVRSIPGDPLPEGNTMLWFQFTSLDLRQTPVEQFRKRNLDAFAVLMLLCRDGATPAILEEILERLLKRKSERKEAIATAFFFASKVLVSEKDRKYLERRREMIQDTLRESWLYQQVLDEGREEGREEGLEKGREEGLEKGREQARQTIKTFVGMRFPASLTWVSEQIEQINELDALYKILSMLFLASTEDEVRAAFSTLR